MGQRKSSIFRTILVPVDLALPSACAFCLPVRLAAASTASSIVAAMRFWIPRRPAILGWPQVRQLLEFWEGRCMLPGVETNLRVRTVTPIAGILRTASGFGVELFVLPWKHRCPAGALALCFPRPPAPALAEPPQWVSGRAGCDERSEYAPSF